MQLLRLLIVPLLLAAPVLPAQEAEKAPPPAADPDAPPLWSTTLAEAVERARAIPNGRILVELRDQSCPECERMEKLLYPSTSFVSFVTDKVPVTLRRGTPDGDLLLQRFRVRAVPAWLVVTPDLVLCGKQEGASNQSTWIERFVESEKGWAAFRVKLEAEKKTPDDLAAAYAVGEEAFRRFGDAMAEERFARIVADPRAPTDLREKSLASLASIALEARRFDDAEKALRQILTTTKDPVLREKAELRLVDVEVGRGERTKATMLLTSFLERHPDSPMRPQAEALLNALAVKK